MDATVGARTLSPTYQRWFLAGILVVVAIVTIQYSFKVKEDGRSAFMRWRPQILRLYDDDIYESDNYPNPPIMALILRPLTLLPPLAGAIAWFYLKIGMTILAVHWVFRLVPSAGQAFPPWAKVLTILLSLRPIMGDLGHGNINLFILLLVVASLYAFGRGRDVMAGMVLALSIACKVTPALFVGYFLWKRAWKALLGCAVGLVLFLWLVPGVFLGMERNAHLLDSWYQHMIQPFVAQGQVTSEHENQSLPGLIFRALTPSPSFGHYEDDRFVPTEYDNFLALNRTAAGYVIKACMALFTGLVMLTCRTPTAPRGGWRLAAEYSLVVVGMLLFSERTWKHHCVTLVLPFAVIAYYLAVAQPGLKLRLYLIGTLGAVALLMASTSSGFLPAWNEYAKRAEVYGVYVWAYLLLVAALGVLLRCGETVEPAESASAKTPAKVA